MTKANCSFVDALQGFYADKLIDDVLRSVKGGKEANVYQCSAHVSTGVTFLAAKVYRPRKHRSLKHLEPDEARALFDRSMKNIERMLTCHRVHADLSAYNILYWKGALTIIDVPQAVDPRINGHAESLLSRDVKRICQYFARQGIDADPDALADDLWSRYMRGEL